MFECLSTHLDKSGFSQVPLFFISPVAETSLAYSNILAEWLSTNKQSKVYLPEEPFPHAFLVKNARLKYYTSTYAEGFSTDYRQPCVVFCGHPSLRFGDAVHFIQMWGNHSQHTVIFTGKLPLYFSNDRKSLFLLTIHIQSNLLFNNLKETLFISSTNTISCLRTRFSLSRSTGTFPTTVYESCALSN